MKKLIFICAIVLSFSTQAQFELSSEILVRSEYRHGFQSLVTQGQDPALELKGGDAGVNNNWGCMMLTAKPPFFQIESK